MLKHEEHSETYAKIEGLRPSYPLRGCAPEPAQGLRP